MKKRNIIIGLVLTLAIGSAVTAFAATTNTTSNTTNNIVNGICGTGMREITGQRGYEGVEAVLKNKLGMTDAEINNARNSGKTLYELAKEKGMTDADFKAALLEEKYKLIDDAVSKGTITKEQGEQYKTQIKTNMDTAAECQSSGGRNGSKMGKNQRGNCS